MADLLYVRNARPNILIVKFAGLKFPLERRGNREDSAALPADAANDPIVSRFIRQGYLEEISKEAFMELGLRTEDKPFKLKTQTFQQKDIIMNDNQDREPTIITAKTLTDTTHLRTPSPEFASRVPSTDEELGFVKPELEEGQIEEIKLLREQLAALTAQVEASNRPDALDELEEEEAPAPKVRKTSTTGTRTSRTTKKS